MNTILTADTQGKVYTGDPREWPDGLYVYNISCLTLYISVCGKEALGWGKDGLVIYDDTQANYKSYRRLPGYTGRIASITPEYVGEGGAEPEPEVVEEPKLSDKGGA